MHHLRHSLIWITLGIVLSAIPCLGGTPSPAGSGTMPDLYPTNLPNITVGPIAYQGPILSDIGMKLIAYEGPHLVDITVEPIQYTHPTVSLVKQPSMKKVNSLSAKPGAMAPVPQLIPGVQPDLKILSAHARPDSHRQRAAGGGNLRLAWHSLRRPQLVVEPAQRGR